MKINRSVREILRTDSLGRCEKARLLYVVSACPAAKDAINAATATAPAKLDAAIRQSTEITASPGGGIFEVAVNYALPSADVSARDTRNPGDRLWKFAVHGTSAARSTAIETVRSIAAAVSPADDPGVLINWNGKHGQEALSGTTHVLEPVFTESCRATFRMTKLNTAYKRRIAALVGKVNSQTFHHWAPGEVLLESIVQSDRFFNASGTELCDLLFTFAIRPNGTRACAGYNIENVDGWDYLWPVTDTLPGTASPRVRSLHISRIYERAPFSALEI